MNIRMHRYLATGQIALERDGKIVWLGKLGDPIEDAEFDTLIVSEADYENIKRQTTPKNIFRS